MFPLELDDFYVSIPSALPWFLIEDLGLCGVLLFRGFLLSILGIIFLTVLWSTFCSVFGCRALDLILVIYT